MAIINDKNLQKKIGDQKYFSLLNNLRKSLLDEGKHGFQWLNGQNIYDNLGTLQQKNNLYHFLGIIPFDFDTKDM
jgi:hypothetical protein